MSAVDLDALRSQATSLAPPGSAEGLALVRNAVLSVIRNPGQDRQLSLLVLAAGALLVLLLLVLVALVLTPSKKRVLRRRVLVPCGGGAIGAGGSPRPAVVSSGSVARTPATRLFLALTSPLAAGIATLLVFGATYAATSSEEYCARLCHTGSEMVSGAAKAEHAPCVSCHERPGLLGVLPNAVSRTRMGVRMLVTRAVTSERLSVDSRGCLRCHGDVLDGVVASDAGARMSHAEVTSRGRPCTSCHAGVGHSQGRYAGGMSACIGCHDGGTASARCPTCHDGDPVSGALAARDATSSAGSGGITYAAVRAANRDCAGCHDMAAQCDPCHGGIRMPHTSAFIQGRHARAAAFSGKLACFRCHEIPQCGRCHSAPFDPRTGLGGHADWVDGHKGASWDSGCACHAARTTRSGPMCDMCHDASTHALRPVEQ